jgi:hypothetical protein
MYPPHNMPSGERWLRVAELVGELAELSVVDLDETVQQLRSSLAIAAVKQRREPRELWSRVARHLLQDSVVNSESLAKMGLEIDLLFRGFRRSIP